MLMEPKREMPAVFKRSIQRTPMKKLHDKSVLLIDDDAGMLRALDKVLASEGAVVVCAAWARDALEMLSGPKSKFDLVITDLQMPYMTGVATGMTVVHAIHEIRPELPVIVLTAFGTPEVRSQCAALGAAAFLEKPLDTAQLLSAVEALCPAAANAR
jgi:CheY-like chemotaxis protein